MQLRSSTSEPNWWPMVKALRLGVNYFRCLPVDPRNGMRPRFSDGSMRLRYLLASGACSRCA